MKLLRSLKKQDLLFPWHPNSKTTARVVFTTKYQADGLDFSEAGFPNLPDLMFDDLTIWGGADVIIIEIEKWNWSRSVGSDSLRNRMCNKCNKAFESCLNHSPPLTPPQFVKDLSSMKLVPSAQKVGDHCSKECVAFVFPRSEQITLGLPKPHMTQAECITSPATSAQDEWRSSTWGVKIQGDEKLQVEG